MKRMLINASQQEELRVALVDGQSLYDLDVEKPGKELKKANVYKGRITRVEPSLEAAFVDYGAERHGFLPMKEVAKQCYHSSANPSSGRPSIKEVLREGQEILIQVDKEERGTKGAALTTYISIAGCYLVLMPNNPGSGGISRRIEGDERDELRQILNQLEMPQDMGVIVRTAGVGRSLEELQWDLNILLKHWAAIKEAADSSPPPVLIHQESDIVMRSIRDYLRMDIGEIVIDNTEIFNKVKKHIELVRPDFVDRVKFYEDSASLFHRFQIETQIESAYQRQVTLPSGGAMVIDHTEACVTVDINSARSTRGVDIEEKALHTNLEAADEIARQLRLRDLGGLVVIDFIDMMPAKHQRDVENRLRDGLSLDRARVQVGRISRFGLLEMSRQRLRSSLEEVSQITCPRCSGSGQIRGVQSLALAIVRVLRESSLRGNYTELRTHVPVDVASYLLNEKRNVLTEIEQRHKTRILVLPHSELETPHYEIERIREGDSGATTDEASYQLAHQIKIESEVEPTAATVKREVPVVNMSQVAPNIAPPKRRSKPGLLSRLLSKLFGGGKAKKRTGNQNRRGGNQYNSRRSGGNSQNNRHRPRRNNNNNNSQRSNDNRASGSQNRESGSANNRPRRPRNANRSANRPSRSEDSSRGHGRDRQYKKTANSDVVPPKKDTNEADGNR